MSNDQVPDQPGWHLESPESAEERWWDGQAWTEHRRPRLEVSRHGTAPQPASALPAASPLSTASTNPPKQATPKLARQPSGRSATAMTIIGVVLFVLGWFAIGSAAATSTVDSDLLESDVVNIPALVVKAVGGLLIALLGATFIGAAIVCRHVASWSKWLRQQQELGRL